MEDTFYIVNKGEPKDDIHNKDPTTELNLQCAWRCCYTSSCTFLDVHDVNSCLNQVDKISQKFSDKILTLHWWVTVTNILITFLK